MFRIGLVGASRVATYAVIAPAATRDDVTVAAVAARDPARARAYAATHGIPKAHDSYAALFADPDIDLVYIGTTPARHRAQVLAALAAGKPVLCEKPFALDAAEAREMLAAARAAGQPLVEAVHSRHHALFARIRAIAASGELGRLRHLEARFEIEVAKRAGEFRWTPALGGGALMDLGLYPLTWCRGLAGAEPVVRRAQMRMEEGVDAAVAAELVFPDGLTAEIHASMIASGRSASLVVTGDEGRMTVRNPLAPQLGHALIVETRAGTREEEVAGPSTYAAQLDAVVRHVRDGTPWPLPPDDPANSMAAIEAVRHAAADAHWHHSRA
ncbi:MAG: Gfo/Idh/MocA family oxidoreductase [Alphaproteobacteria bacterium]|nr:Gfo/Idh/MocA family oxidoreductase [Alphaproteobacteria bacterium]